MLAKFNLYIIIGLILLLVATSSGFMLYHRITKAELAAERAQNAILTQAVDQQRNTIETLQKDAEALAKANRFLSSRMAETEAQFTAEWSAIEALDLVSGTGEPGELEKRLNDEFSRSIDELRKSTARK